MTASRIPSVARRVAILAGLSIAVLACGPGPVVSPSLSSASNIDPSSSPSTLPSASAPATNPPVASTSPSPDPSPSTTPGATASPTPAPTPSPKPTPKPTAPTNANVGVELCTKLTVAEVGNAVGVTPLTARADPGDKRSGSCRYLAGDRAVAATSFLVSGGKQAMSMLAGQGQAISDLGDAALWIVDRQTVYVRQGDSVMTVKLTPTIVPADQAKAKTIALARLAAPRW